MGLIEAGTDRYTRVRYGLQLPDGTIVWDQYAGLDLSTDTGRAKVVALLAALADRLHFPKNEFLGHYRWATRNEDVTIAYDYCATSPVAPVDGEVTETIGVLEDGDDQGAAAEDHARAVRPGHLGGTA